MLFTKKVYLKSLLKKSEIENAVFSIITPLNKSYNGEINKTNNGKYDFKIYRIINGRNSFQPIIKGTVFEKTSETIIKLIIGMHPFVKVFIAIWLSGLVIIGLPLSIFSLLDKNIAFIIPIIMLIFFRLLIQFAYINEYKKTIIDLIKLFNAEETAYRESACREI